MELALEVGAGIVLLLVMILIADRDDGAAGKVARVAVVLIVFGALAFGGYRLAYAFGIIGPVPDTHTGR